MESLEKIGKMFIVLRGSVQGSEFRSNYRKCFKKSKKVAKKSGKFVLKKGMALTIVTPPHKK